MAKNPTNREIVDTLERVDSRLEKIETKMESFNEFMITEKALRSRKADGSIDWQGLIKQALVFLTITSSSVYMLVEFIIKRAQQ